ADPVSESHGLKAKKKITALNARRVIWLRNSAIAFTAVCGVLVALPSQGNFDPASFLEETAKNEASQPKLFSMLARKERHSDASARAEELRQRSEEALAQELDDEACAPNVTVKDDCQRLSNGGSREQVGIDPNIKADIEKASLPAPFGPFGDGGPVPTGDGGIAGLPGPVGFPGDGFGLPIGPITGTLPGVVLPVVPAQGGGTLPRTGPVGSPDPAGPKEPVVMEAPESEVPIPAPLILFPAGLALLWKAKRRSA
ncbi:MAG: hypothetical protein AAF368_19965, partial [Planctomycetota bacterium]